MFLWFPTLPGILFGLCKFSQGMAPSLREISCLGGKTRRRVERTAEPIGSSCLIEIQGSIGFDQARDQARGLRARGSLGVAGEGKRKGGC